MIGLQDMAAQVKRISPAEDGYQYFFGYYDIPSFDNADGNHLCSRVRFWDRLPKPTDRNELGILNLNSGEFTALGETFAWNFQQGSMLQWFPYSKDTVIYNTWEQQEYRSTIQNIHTGDTRTLPCPVATVSPDGKYALSINFNRVYDFRPGYGYCNRQDPWKDQPHPDDDGVVLMNLQTGDTKQIISYHQLDKLFGNTHGVAGKKIVINHITINPSSNRFLFLVRYFADEGEQWRTGLGTSDLDGNIYLLRNYTYASHYNWKDEKTILIYADCGEGDALYELTDETQDYIIYDRDFFNEDIHCSYSPDRDWIIGDGYADANHYRSIFLYHISNKKKMLLGRVYAPNLSHFDIRSDLHCRWSHCGKKISFDSIHEGFRGLYIMDIGDAMASLD